METILQSLTDEHKARAEVAWRATFGESISTILDNNVMCLQGYYIAHVQCDDDAYWTLEVLSPRYRHPEFPDIYDAVEIGEHACFEDAVIQAIYYEASQRAGNALSDDALARQLANEAQLAKSMPSPHEVEGVENVVRLPSAV